MFYLANFSSIFSLLRNSASFFISSSCSFWRTFCSSWPCFLLCISLSNSSFCSRSLRSACFTRISSSSLKKTNKQKTQNVPLLYFDLELEASLSQNYNRDGVCGAFTDLLTCSSFSSSLKGVLAPSPLSLPLPSPEI